MKPLVLIDAEVSPMGGTLLLEVAMGLREQRLRPDSLTWSTNVGEGKVKLAIELAADAETRLASLVDRFREISGVQKVTVEKREMPL